MPVSMSRSGVFALVAGFLAITNVGVNAVPYPRDDMNAAGFGYLVNRDCPQYCGYNNQYCCAANQVCFTSGNIAGCSATAGGGFALYTTTWTQTETFTSTISSYFPASTAANNQQCVPPPGSGWIACGTICCASNQYCAWQGQCLPNGVAGGGGGGSGGGGGGQMTTYTSGGQVYTTQYSAPFKVTSGATMTSQSGILGGATTSPSPTSSGAVVAGGTASSLSPGAIAGIVIGVLAGIVILLVICACCVVRGLWHGILGLLGLRKKDSRKSRETVIEEERYSRHGSVHSRRDRHGGWFGGGGRPSAAGSRREKEKKSGGGLGWLGLAGAIGTILLLLGLRRDSKKKQQRQSKARSDYSSTYYSDSYTASSPSSLSSDRRTRDSRRSRRTEGTRVSRAPSRR